MNDDNEKKMDWLVWFAVCLACADLVLLIVKADAAQDFAIALPVF